MTAPVPFGKYLLLERIAVGGMAEVFAGKACGVEGFERLLAIKKILPTLGEDRAFTSMFVDEARLAVQLAHPNIVQVHELGRHDRSLYIAMEYIAGRDLRTLAEALRRRGAGLPVAPACFIAAQVCAALDYAHQKRDAAGQPLNVVHRDVSPQNILATFEGEVKLIDFGIAKAERRLQQTESGVLKGKFAYMSPEQVRGEPVDGRSDVFALGIVLWELLAGRRLFAGESDLAVLERVRDAAVPSLRTVNPAIPEGLDRLVLRALAADPRRRFRRAAELQQALVPFTVEGGQVFGARDLAAFVRAELADEWTREEARVRQWMSSPAAHPDPLSSPSARFRLPADADTLAQPPENAESPGPAEVVDLHALPTLELDAAQLAEAERQRLARAGDAPKPRPRIAGTVWAVWVAALALLLFAVWRLR